MKTLGLRFSIFVLGVAVYLNAGYATESNVLYAEADEGVAVTIVSDKTTWISIRGAKSYKPEKFKKKTYELPPGLYEVIGRKKGKMDERIRLEVVSGTSPITLKVFCTRPWSP